MKVQKNIWVTLFILSLLTAQVTFAQNVNIQHADSLRRELAKVTHDTTRAIILADLAEAYRTERPDSTLYFADQTLQLCREIDYPFGEMRAYLVLCFYFHLTVSDIPQAQETGRKALEIAEKYGFKEYEGVCLIRVAQVKLFSGDPQAAFNDLKRANKVLLNRGDPFFHAVTYWWMASCYLAMKKPDSALYIAQIGRDKAIEIKSDRVLSQVLKIMARVYASKGDVQLAKQYYMDAIDASEKMNELVDVANGYMSLAYLFRNSKQNDSAIYYAAKAYDIGRPRSINGIIIFSGEMLSNLLASSDPAEALRYLKIANVARDSVYNAQKLQSAQGLLFKERERRTEMAFEKKVYQSSIRQYALLAGVGLLLFVTFNLYRNNKNKQKANHALEKQKEKVEKTLGELKATQAQLIQSEKMASLGELTAGIAHEIQNPLNFVNNFSEVNRELIAELKTETSKPKAERDDQVENELINVIEQNLGKIDHHGKRADAIVKGMLQHARSSGGQTEPTDLNALCDEYLRLAYHGFRAKNKSRDGQTRSNGTATNIRLETDFDTSAPKINVVRQEIGRVILNLINNALYAVSQKKTEHVQTPDYEPTVTISTKKSSGKVLVSVKDNGIGIPDSIKDKIFQPFFTTKPVGQGTGLGLSLTYDIVKAHGGVLRVETRLGDGTEFIIQLNDAYPGS